MLKRGRPTEIEERVTLSVSFAKRQIDFMKLIGVGISEFTREAVDLKIETMTSPDEKIDQEIEKRLKLVEENQIIIEELMNRKLKMEHVKQIKEDEQRQANEFISQRIEIFNKEFRGLIYDSVLCINDFYPNVKKRLNFKDISEAKEWLYEMYKIPQPGCKKYTEERIKTFLRWDSDMSRFW